MQCGEERRKSIKILVEKPKNLRYIRGRKIRRKKMKK